MHLDGHNASEDFECPLTSDAVHPVGYSAFIGVPLHNPPKLPDGNAFTWEQYLAANDVLPVPLHLFSARKHAALFEKIDEMSANLFGDTLVSSVFLRPFEPITVGPRETWSCCCCDFRTDKDVPDENTEKNGVGGHKWVYKGAQWVPLDEVKTPIAHPRLAPDTSFMYETPSLSWQRHGLEVE